MHLSQHKIAAGHNAVDDLEFIGELEAGGLRFSEPVGADHGYIPGKMIMRLDNKVTVAGKDRQTFVMGMTFPQYQYALENLEGDVTVQTRWFGNAWAIYNTTLVIQRAGMGKVWGGFKDVQWTYYDLRLIP